MRWLCLCIICFYICKGLGEPCSEDGEECIALRFCPFDDGEKPDRNKFCGDPGFLRYCCNSKEKQQAGVRSKSSEGATEVTLSFFFGFAKLNWPSFVFGEKGSKISVSVELTNSRAVIGFI